MALDRKYQKIFAKNADGNDLAVVGSKNAGNIETSTDVEEIQSLSNWMTGLRAQVTTNDAPYLQDQNSIFYVITSQLAYLFQAGIAEWNSQTEYIANRSVVLKNGKIYIAIADSINVEPEVTNEWLSYWREYINTADEYYAICTSSYSSNKKEITLNNLVPSTGTRIKVRFNDLNGGSIKLSDTPYLNIHIGENSINAIIQIGKGGSVNSVASFCWSADEIIEFRLVREGVNTWYAYCDNIVYRTGVSSDENYCKYFSIRRDGWVEQEGWATKGTGDYTTSIALPITMSDTNYFCGVDYGGATVSVGHSQQTNADIRIVAHSTSSVVIYAYFNISNPNKLYWQVKGYKG